MSGEYDDIINLPYKKSDTRPHMALIDRAAQFSPFAALTNHSNAIKETGRLTNERITLDEDSLYLLDSRLQVLLENINQHPTITLTYFVQDRYKDGGDYVEAIGQVKKIDEYKSIIILYDGRRINISDVINIAGDIFHKFNF